MTGNKINLIVKVLQLLIYVVSVHLIRGMKTLNLSYWTLYIDFNMTSLRFIHATFFDFGTLVGVDFSHHLSF